MAELGHGGGMGHGGMEGMEGGGVMIMKRKPPPKKIPYISGNRNPENAFYILGN